jgi:hypothetical protein
VCERGVAENRTTFRLMETSLSSSQFAFQKLDFRICVIVNLCALAGLSDWS